MILKSLELKNYNKKKHFFLFYGENNGLKIEIIQKVFEDIFSKNIFRYDENEILNNKDNFLNGIYTKSFFDENKLIIISRVTEKIKEIIEEIIEKNISDLTIILNAGALEKKSKIRNFFEKGKNTICTPFYSDTNQTLGALTSNFFREKKISISQQTINIIVDRSRGDRANLKNELNKIENFIKNKNKIDIEDILKLTNLSENHSISELIDNCLAKNKRKTINILNENNFSLDDCIVITRTFLIKSKRLLKLCIEAKNQNNIDNIISTFKPPIFWKDKEIIKQQINNWSYKSVENLIFNINKIELLIKKNSEQAINILSDFIIDQTTTTNN